MKKLLEVKLTPYDTNRIDNNGRFYSSGPCGSRCGTSCAGGCRTCKGGGCGGSVR